MYPVEKYTYSIGTSRKDNKIKVYAISTYAGKPVVGVATCAPDDHFSAEAGRALAAARCAVKVAKKRKNRAQKKVYEAQMAAIKANDYLDKMITYMEDATCEIEEAESNLAEILDEMMGSEKDS